MPVKEKGLDGRSSDQHQKQDQEPAQQAMPTRMSSMPFFIFISIPALFVHTFLCNRLGQFKEENTSLLSKQLPVEATYRQYRTYFTLVTM